MTVQTSPSIVYVPSFEQYDEVGVEVSIVFVIVWHGAVIVCEEQELHAGRQTTGVAQTVVVTNTSTYTVPETQVV